MTWLRLNHQYTGTRRNTLQIACPFADVGSNIDNYRRIESQSLHAAKQCFGVLRFEQFGF
jgi:hypothetical protein